MNGGSDSRRVSFAPVTTESFLIIPNKDENKEVEIVNPSDSSVNSSMTNAYLMFINGDGEMGLVTEMPEEVQTNTEINTVISPSPSPLSSSSSPGRIFSPPPPVSD
jgi:hypothetical protein